MTVVSTARDDKRSGIRFMGAGGAEMEESAATDIEIIQRVHRYAVVWPSIHDKLGTEYRWYRSDNWQPITDGVPSATRLPMLPDAWIEELPINPSTSGPPSGSTSPPRTRTASSPAVNRARPCGAR